MLLAVHDVRLRFWRVFELNMIGQFFSAFLLGTTGGDVIKIFYVARAVPDRKAAVGFTVVVDRVIGMIALLLVGAVLAIPNIQLLMSQHYTKLYTALFYLFVLGGVGASILASIGPALLKHPTIRSLAKRLPLVNKGASIFAAYEKTAHAFGINVIALVGSIPSHLCIILMGWCILQALGMNNAAAFSLTYFTLNLVWSLFGAPFYFLYRHETHAPAPDTTQVEPIFSK